MTHTVGPCTGDAKGSKEEENNRSVKDKLNRLMLRVQPDDTLDGGTKFSESDKGPKTGTTGGGRLEFAAMSFDARVWQ